MIVKERTEELRDAHNEIIQSEKLIAINKLIKDIAHNINTPLGISITSASYIERVVASFCKIYDENKISKKNIEEFFLNHEKSYNLLISGLEKSATLIDLFRLITRDEISLKRSVFNVKREIEKNISMIKVLMNETFLSIIISDNGKGISEQDLVHVFEPFYTTGKNSSTIGFGLSVVYYSVRHILNGNIEIFSQVEGGTEVKLNFRLFSFKEKRKRRHIMKFINQIESYIPGCEQEENDKKIILEHIKLFKHNVLTRENQLAHMTSSGFIMNKNCDKVLMIHHNIYNTWSWTGGHSDGDEDLLETAIKEAQEETGVKSVVPLLDEVASIDVLPVWGHVKKGKYVSAHLHLNVSFILIADENEKLIINEEETSDVKWISISEVEEHSKEPFLIEIYFKLINRAKNEMRR